MTFRITAPAAWWPSCLQVLMSRMWQSGPKHFEPNPFTDIKIVLWICKVALCSFKCPQFVLLWCSKVSIKMCEKNLHLKVSSNKLWSHFSRWAVRLQWPVFFSDNKVRKHGTSTAKTNQLANKYTAWKVYYNWLADTSSKNCKWEHAVP